MSAGNKTEKYLTRNNSMYATQKYFVLILNPTHQLLELQRDKPESQKNNLLKGYILITQLEGIMPKSLQQIDD